MGHHHNHNHDTDNIKVAFFLNLLFTMIEFVGGIYTNSLAIMSDALHDLGDSFSLGLSWYFQKLSKKEANHKFSYGYKRFSLLGAIINSVILTVGSVFIMIEAFPRLIKPEQSDAQGMMWLAILGIIVNGIAVLRLNKGTSLNEKVVALHLFEDVLGWSAILLGSIIMQFYEVPILDPILSLSIAAYILYNVTKNIKESLHIILQGTPKNINTENIKKSILSFREISDIHNCHLWTMDGEYNVLTVHLVLNTSMKEVDKIADVKSKIKQMLSDKFSLKNVTLEIELNKEVCSYRESTKG